MKKTHKKILGFLGILAVAAVTTFAVFLPAPDTQATTTASVTDTIEVRVINKAPSLTLSDIDQGEIITLPQQEFTVHYSNVETVKLKIQHTDFENNATTYDLDEIFADYVDGETDYVINFISGAGEEGV